MTRPTRPGTSPLLGRYLVRNRAWNAWLRLNDLALEIFNLGGAPTSDVPRTFRRILVAVGGHLGDAVIATSLLRDLHGAFPRCEIGVVTGTWNRAVFERHPRVQHLHVVDHWKLSRAPEPLITRWMSARHTRALATAEIRKVGYDAAIDLSAYYPNAARLLWSAGIPVRVGYVSGGDGPLYTHRVTWRAGRRVAEDHRVLLSQIAPDFRDDAPACELPPVDVAAAGRAESALRDAGIAIDRFVVAHAGAGHPRKEWRADNWEMVCRNLVSAGLGVILTGRGEREASAAAHLAERVPGVANLADRLSWEEFRAVIARARAVLSVDTVAMHLAAAAGTPCVSLMAAMDDPMRWSPLSDRSTVLTHAVPCAPCFRSRGCAEMSCVRDIAPETVLAAARRSAKV